MSGDSVPICFEHRDRGEIGDPFLIQPDLEVPVGPSLVGPSRACVAPPGDRSSTFLDVLRELLEKEGVVRRAAL